MRNMIKSSDASNLTGKIEDDEFGFDLVEGKFKVPKEAEVIEISGPRFFGAAYELERIVQIKVINEKVIY